MPVDLLQPGFTLAFLIAALVVGFTWQAVHPKRLPLPPGPKSWSPIGFRFKPYAWRHMEEISKEYGPVSCVRLGTAPLIIVATVKAAQELLERQSGTCSDRPRFVMAAETMGGGMRTLTLRYGDKWRQLRKLLHAQLQQRAAEKYEPIQERASRRLVLDLLEDSSMFGTAAGRYAASVIMTITYGKTTPTSYSDEEVVQVNKCLARFGQAAKPGSCAVDTFPFLRFVPGWMSEGRRWHKEELQLFKGQVQNVRKEVQNGSAPESFSSTMIENQKEYQLSDDEAAYLAGSMFGAGSHTTASAIAVVIMAAACFPEKAKLARDELDRVLGDKRLPSFADAPDLPYVTAFYRETFRWRPVTAGGFMHRCTEDMVYNGYLIPAGASIVGNHWSIHRDPDYYEKPEEFLPERWLKDGPDGQVLPNKELRHFQYGFGRRVCPGSHVADRSVFINTANLLWAFDIELPKDSDGKDIPIDTLAFTTSANSHPLPFKVDITPRKSNLRSLVEEMGSGEEAATL